MSESMSEMSEDAAVNDDGLLDTVFDAMCELAGEDGRGCLCARFRCGPPCGWSDCRRMGVYGSRLQGCHETRGGILHFGCATNREVQADLIDTEIGMALAQGGTKDWRVLVFP